MRHPHATAPPTSMSASFHTARCTIALAAAHFAAGRSNVALTTNDSTTLLPAGAGALTMGTAADLVA